MQVEIKYPRWLYHAHKPEGVLIRDADHMAGLEKSFGTAWVDSPAHLAAPEPEQVQESLTEVAPAYQRKGRGKKA